MTFTKEEPQLKERNKDMIITEEQILISEKLNHGLVHRHNFDTFSFLFELLELAEDLNISLDKAYEKLKLDSINLTSKYNGSNCGGLTMVLRQDLAERDIGSVLIPCFGSYMPTPEADAYAGIRTIGLYIQTKDERYLLAPGLTIPIVIKLKEDNQFESYNTQYIIQNVFPNRFSIVAIKHNQEIIERVFSLIELINPDESSQKNLLRCRPKYQITRQYVDGKKDSLTFDFFRTTFRIALETRNINLTLNTNDFELYLTTNGNMLEELFKNKNLIQGFRRFLQEKNNIIQSILLPSLKDKLIES